MQTQGTFIYNFNSHERIQTKQGLDALATLSLKDYKKSLTHSKLVELLASDGRCSPNGNARTGALFPSPLASVVRACVEGLYSSEMLGNSCSKKTSKKCITSGIFCERDSLQRIFKSC